MRNLILFVFSCFILLACGKTPEVQTLTGLAQGTTYTIKYWADKSIKATSPSDRLALKSAIDAELARIDQLMSNYRDDSVIEQFNQQKIANKPFVLEAEILEVLRIADEVYQKSNHCYDPTINPLFRLWGFKDGQLNIPNSEQVQAVLKNLGFDQMTRTATQITKHNTEVTIDLSAIGQGYAIAKIAQQLEERGVVNYLVEIGGEMLVAGTKPKAEQWRVGVERPIPDSQKIHEVITLTGKRPTAVMTSGTYRHYYDDKGRQYSHILDPRSGRPVSHNSVAVTVLLENPTYADAWSTALLCLGSHDGLVVANQYQIPAIFYDLEQGKLQRWESQSVKAQSPYWQTSP